MTADALHLDGAVAVVTGATGGIGGAIATDLAGRGARLVLTARRAGALDALATEVRSGGGQAVTVDGDVADPATADRVVAEALAAFGRVDVLVNAAGYGPPAPLVDTSDGAWSATIGSCLTGPFLMTRAVLPPMLAAGRGRIVQISSVAGTHVEADRTAYCAAKWGLQGLSLALAEELRDTGVRVHVLNPASVATGWWTATGDPQPADVLHRMLAPADVARAVVWVLTQPGHVHVTALAIGNDRSPWRAAPGG